jgi:hypothetical protein
LWFLEITSIEMDPTRVSLVRGSPGCVPEPTSAFPDNTTEDLLATTVGTVIVRFSPRESLPMVTTAAFGAGNVVESLMPAGSGEYRLHAIQRIREQIGGLECVTPLAARWGGKIG